MELKKLEAEIREHFGQYGKITSVKIDKNPKFPRPFGYLCFDNHADAQKAIDAVNNKDVFNNGQSLFCDFHKTKGERRREW